MMMIKKTEKNDYEPTAYAIRKRLEKALYSLDTLNSYITTRNNYQVLIEEGVMDPTWIVDLEADIKSLSSVLKEQSSELEELRSLNQILTCKLIKRMSDADLEYIVMICQNKGIRTSAGDLVSKADDRSFSPEEFAFLAPMLRQLR